MQESAFLRLLEVYDRINADGSVKFAAGCLEVMEMV